MKDEKKAAMLSGIRGSWEEPKVSAAIREPVSKAKKLTTSKAITIAPIPVRRKYKAALPHVRASFFPSPILETPTMILEITNGISSNVRKLRKRFPTIVKFLITEG
jgi:hypothetical protein